MQDDPYQYYIDLLSHEHPEARRDGAIRLGEERVRQAIPLLRNLLQDGDLMVRIAVAGALGQMGEEQETVIPFLLDTLQHNNRYTSNFAATQLGLIGQPAELLVPALLENCTSFEAVCALRSIESPEKEILAGLQNTNPVVRAGAICTIPYCNFSTQQKLSATLQAMEDEAPGVRIKAVYALEQINEPTDSVIRALLHALHDPDIEPKPVIEAIGNIATQEQYKTHRLVETILPYAEHQERYTRVAVAELFGKAKLKQENIKNTLFDMLHDEELRVARVAASSLEELGESPLELNSYLFRLLRCDSHDTKLMAYETLLERLASTDVLVDQLIEVLLECERHLRSETIERLGELGESANKAASFLVPFSEYEYGFASTVKTLGFIGPSKAGISTLLSMASEAHDDVHRQREIIRSLSRLKATEAKELFLQALQNQLEDALFDFEPDEAL